MQTRCVPPYSVLLHMQPGGGDPLLDVGSDQGELPQGGVQWEGWGCTEV